MLLVLKALIPNDRSLSREEIGLPAEVAYYTRALSLYNPFRNSFFTCSRRAAHYTQDPSDTQSFSAKKPVLAGLSAPSWPSEIGNPALPTFRVATDTLNKVRFERDRGLRN